MTEQNTPNPHTATTGNSIDDAKATAESLRDDAVDAATSLRDRATEEAAHQAEAAKSGVASEISDMGRALRRASDELRDGSPQERSFGYMAEALADLSDSVRDKDLGEMVGDISAFARRHPGAFLGGAALLGFAGVRVAKASQRNRDRAVDLTDAFGSDEDDDALEAEMFGARGAPRSPASPHTAYPAAPSARR